MKPIEDENDDRALVALKAQAALEAVEETLRTAAVLEDYEALADLTKARRVLYDVLAVYGLPR